MSTASPDGRTRALSAGQAAAAGRSIYEAERAARTRPPLSVEHPAMTLADAYAVQHAYAGLRTSAGATRVGHKVGATSRAIQELFGIDTPDYGQIFDDMVVADGVVDLDELIQPMVEPEVAFILAAELAGPGVDADDVLAATRALVPCIEVIDSRIVDWRIRLVDTIADNGSSARCVFGPEVPVAGIDLVALPVEFRRGPEIVATATGAAVLGNPAAAVAWLANTLGEYGAGLEAGSVVLSGSFTTAQRAAAGESYEAAFPLVGSVRCRFVSGGGDGS